jgi:glycosyltransferase involved in cell wall biosynthesis
VLGHDFAELAPYADAKGTAEAIVRVVERQERGELSAEQLRRDYVARYGWDRFRERWADLLHGVSAARRSA